MTSNELLALAVTGPLELVATAAFVLAIVRFNNTPKDPPAHA